MKTEEQNKMLAMLAALTAQVIENMADELQPDDYEKINQANDIAWKYRKDIFAEQFYIMAKDAEKITRFSK